jgi:tetratricopeptide (TPR) repeat protein
MLQQRFQNDGRDYTPYPYFEDMRRHLDLLAGWRCNEEGNFDRCLELADKILLCGRDAYSMTLRGCALMGLKRYREAEEQFREALCMTPAPSSTHLELARVLQFQNRFAEAENELVGALPQMISEAKAPRMYLDLLGTLWTSGKTLQDRTAIMAMLHRSLPLEPEVWILNARRLMIAGDRDEAERSLCIAAEAGLAADRIRALRAELGVQAG